MTSIIPNINFNKLIDDNNNTIEEIFTKIKAQKWDDVKKIIKSSNINLNIKDDKNIFLLEYAVIFNQIEIIDLLLDKNVRIDIVDDMSRSILFNIIKFSYVEILIKLLEKNKKSIGKSILEIKDKDGNIPLFYAIQCFNIKCVEIILSYTNNFYIKNSNGDNPLHLAIKFQNFELFKIILSNFNDLKSRNNLGESYLHLIIKYKCYDMLEFIIKMYNTNENFIQLLNFVETQYNFTILHYICIELDFESLQIISNLDMLKFIDGNIQDNSGNIFYHYFINNIINIEKITTSLTNDIINMNELFKNINFNINLYNIDGNTPAHILFININYFILNNLNILINNIIEKIDLNIQNFKGESIFYIIIRNNYWSKIYNILINKKIDIFIIANNSTTIFDYIDKKDYEEFINMISLSYLNQLLNSDKSKKWLEYWDNRCKKIIKLNELNDTELEFIKNIDIKNNDNICFDIIKNKIKNSITTFIENKNIFESSSFPVSNKFNKLISNYPSVVISTFSGSTIDILSGFIFLINKFNKSKKNYLTTSLNLIEDKNNIIKCKKIKSNNNEHKICEIYGFEIYWINKNIQFPQNKYNNIHKILIWMNEHKNDGYRWFIIPIGIEINTNSHANYLIFDIEMMEVERFEPHGAYPPLGLNYDSELLDNILINYIFESGLKFKYFKPLNYLPKIGFQIKEINELNNDYIGDPNGFCALWCIWWADLRLTNPEITRDKLVKNINKELINGNYSYKKIIRDYSGFIIEIRDKLFLKANTNINEWINDTISNKNIDLLNSSIKDIIEEITI